MRRPDGARRQQSIVGIRKDPEFGQSWHISGRPIHWKGRPTIKSLVGFQRSCTRMAPATRVCGMHRYQAVK